MPPLRPDVIHECDIWEDVAISYGYNNVKWVSPAVRAVTLGREECGLGVASLSLSVCLSLPFSLCLSLSLSLCLSLSLSLSLDVSLSVSLFVCLDRSLCLYLTLCLRLGNSHDCVFGENVSPRSLIARIYKQKSCVIYV